MLKCPICNSKQVWSDKPQFEPNGNIILHCECANRECDHKWTGHYDLIETKNK